MFNVFDNISYRPLDGLGCGVVGKVMLDEPTDVWYVNNDEVDGAIKKAMSRITLYKHVFITDLSPSSEDIMELMSRFKGKFTMLDHHATALNYNKYPFCTVKVNRYNKQTCATELLYYHLYHRITEMYRKDKYMDINYDEDRLLYFVNLVTRYDTWRWYNDRDTETDVYLGDKAKQLNDLLSLVKRDEFVQSMYDSIMNNRTFFPNRYLKLLEEEKYKREKCIKDKIKDSHEQVVKINGINYKIGFAISDMYISELGNKMCEELDIDFAMIMTDKHLSFRCIDERVNVGEIAKSLGGGGHRCSAGCPYNKVDIINLLLNKR